MAMTELQKQIIILKIQTAFKIIWAILKPLAVIVLVVGFVVFGALFSILGASLTGKGRK
jgi:nitrogen fixation/metabolism regulation signal transduction histidine kinase